MRKEHRLPPIPTHTFPQIQSETHHIALLQANGDVGWEAIVSERELQVSAFLSTIVVGVRWPEKKDYAGNDNAPSIINGGGMHFKMQPPPDGQGDMIS